MPAIGYMAIGSGSTSDQAWQSCLGEAAEILSILRRPDDVSFKGFEINNSKPCQVARELVTSADASSPTDPGNEGAAAGTSFEQASDSALLERFERAAVFNWWTGRQTALAVPDSWISSAGLNDLVATARVDADHKRSDSIIVLDHRYSVWTMAAVSRDAGDRTPVIGYGAATDPVYAAKRAIGELFQMELGLHMAERASQAQKTSTHASVFRRIDAFENTHKRLISPTSEISMSDLNEHRGGETIQEIARKHFDSVVLVDMTRKDIGVPVCRALTRELPTARPLKFAGGACPL